MGYIAGKKFLGYSFYKNKGKKWRFCLHPKSYDKLKNRLKELTSRNQGKSFEEIKGNLWDYVIGWVAYFKLADMSEKLKETDKWLRFRIRMLIWKSWKKVSTKYKNLKKMGIEENQAYQWANTRKGYCRTAHSPILNRALNIKILRKAGYPNLTDRYLKSIAN